MENNSESSFVIDVNYENPINYSLQFGSLDAQPFDSKKKEVAADEEQQNLRSNHPHPPPLGIKNKAVTVDEAQWLKPMIEKIDSDSNLEEEIMESEVDENMNKHENQLRRRYPERKTSPNVLPTALPMPEVEPPAVQDLLPMIDEVFRSLIENTKTIKVAKVENQKICVYVHFRNVDEKNWATLAQCVRDILKDYPRLRLTQSTKALEVRPAIDWNKGKAIESLLESLGLINNRTDEDAFKNPNNSMNSNKLYIEKISRGQIFAVINFIIEVPMLVFGQLLSSNHQILHAILAMSFSIMTMIVSIGEFIYRGRKASVVWRWRKIPWFYYPSPSRSKLFGSAIDILGLLCAIFQFIFSIIEFSFYIRHKDNPIKVSMWPPVFAFCVMWSQFLDNSSEMMLPRYRSTGDYNLN